MLPFFLALLIYLAASIVAMAGSKRLSYALSLVASLLAFSAGLGAIISPESAITIDYAFGLKIVVALDPMGSLFLLIVSLSAALLSLFAIDYGRFSGLQTAAAFPLGLIGVLIVLAAGDGLSFLFGWEIATISAFLMVSGGFTLSRDGGAAPARPLTSASFRFLMFGELSFVLLLLAMAGIFATTGSLALGEMKSVSPLFLALLSLGIVIKLDAVPFHVWMPGVYEHASDHASAFLSVPLTLMGLYSLERVLSLADFDPAWLLFLILLGAVSAFWGALHAAASRTLKTLPAYSTVEANGMILATIAMAALARGEGGKSLAYLSDFALAAALILALGHALAKTLLFMSIGHAKEFLGVKTIDETRGVWKVVGRVPGLGIFVSGLSLAAMPPLLGYAGEWMILETFFQSSRFSRPEEVLPLVMAGILLALAIGLTVFAMVKLIGYTAVGYHHNKVAPRLPAASMRVAQVAAIVLLPLFGLGLPLFLPWFGFKNLFGGLLGVPAPLLLVSGDPLFGVLSPTMFGLVILILCLVPLAVWRGRSGTKRGVSPWYGGQEIREEEFYSEPAFSQILLHQFRRLYGARESADEGRAQLRHRDRFVAPLERLSEMVQSAGSALSRVFMNGKVHYYVLYIFIALLAVALLPF